MGATKTDEGFLPSRSLSVIEGLAKGFSMYGKELKEREQAKKGQMADAFKIIFPQYMKMMMQTQQQQFEAPYKRGAMNLELEKLRQTGELGWAGIAARITDIEGEWEIAKLGAKTSTDIAAADRALKANLEGVRAMITKFSETEATKRTAMGVAGRAAVSEAEIESREKVARKRAEDTFENQMRIQADEYRLKGLQLDREIAAGKYAQVTTDPIIGQKFTNYRAMINAVGEYGKAVSILATTNPKAGAALHPSYQSIQRNLAAMEADLNRDLAPLGQSIPGIQMPEFETEEKGWLRKRQEIIPKIPGTPARGAAPSVSKTEDINKYAQQMVDNNWYMTPEDRVRFKQLGVDPDAIEAEAKRRRKSK